MTKKRVILPAAARPPEIVDPPCPTCILLYGKDSRLLQTRQWVLENAGYRVLATTDLSEDQLKPPVELLILCHTLSCEGEHGEVSETTRAIGRGVKILTMTTDLPTMMTEAGDHFLNAFDGPETLLATVKMMCPNVAQLRHTALSHTGHSGINLGLR
jgi:hypothetical protein